MHMKASFSKNERLQSRKKIECLLKEGQSLMVYPLKLIWKSYPAEGSSCLKTAVLVPRRNFSRAVDRNLIRRRIREVFRKKKHLVSLPLSENLVSADLLILYLGKDIKGSKEIEEKLLLCLQKWVGAYEKGI